jgi:hypothetical protein
MAKDMSHLFANGAFFGGNGQSSQKSQRWENDLFKNAMKTFKEEDQLTPRKVGSAQQQLSRNTWSQVPTVNPYLPSFLF